MSIKILFLIYIVKFVLNKKLLVTLIITVNKKILKSKVLGLLIQTVSVAGRLLIMPE